MSRQKDDTLHLKIRENSWVARLAAKKLGTKRVAIVIGKTVHLYNATRNDLVLNEKWLKHEMCHLQQFRQYGLITFIFKYLWESFKNGYKGNKYEAEARKAENSAG